MSNYTLNQFLNDEVKSVIADPTLPPHLVVEAEALFSEIHGYETPSAMSLTQQLYLNEFPPAMLHATIQMGLFRPWLGLCFFSRLVSEDANTHLWGTFLDSGPNVKTVLAEQLNSVDNKYITERGLLPPQELALNLFKAEELDTEKKEYLFYSHAQEVFQVFADSDYDKRVEFEIQVLNALKESASLRMEHIAEQSMRSMWENDFQVIFSEANPAEKGSWLLKINSVRKNGRMVSGFMRIRQDPFGENPHYAELMTVDQEFCNICLMPFFVYGHEFDVSLPNAADIFSEAMVQMAERIEPGECLHDFHEEIEAAANAE